MPDALPLFVPPVNQINVGNEFEKANILLGLGNDTFVVDNNISNLSVEYRGGPGDDTFAVRTIPAAATVILGESGTNDTLRVLVDGNPQVDQFKNLVVSAGIERLSIDNSANTNQVDWIVSQGSLHFVDGQSAVTVNVAANTLTFTPANFTARPLANGDRILIGAKKCRRRDQSWRVASVHRGNPNRSTGCRAVLYGAKR